MTSSDPEPKRLQAENRRLQNLLRDCERHIRAMEAYAPGSLGADLKGQLLAHIQQEIGSDPLASDGGDDVQTPVGIWRHKPTGNVYLVLGVASDSNNVKPRKELQVVYVSLVERDRLTWPMHVRSLPEFLDRFELVDGGGPGV